MSEEKITREQRRKVRDVKRRSGVIVEVDGSRDQKYLVDLAARSCTCPAWRFQKKPIGERICKHIEAALRKDAEMWPTNSGGYSLLQTMIVISIMVILVAIAVPMFRSVARSAMINQALQIADAGNAALRLDFSQQLVTTGEYKSPFPDDKQKVGKQLRKANREALEAMLRVGGYPLEFKWILTQAATPISPPVVAGEIR